MISELDFIELNTNFKTNGNCFFRKFILFIIPAILYAVIVLGYLNGIDFNVELHSVILIGLIFLIYINFMKHNAYFSSCKFRKQYINLKKNLQQYINKNALVIDDNVKANASIDNFLHKFTLTLRNKNFSSIASGIFPTLGILGTFISIALSMPDFSSQSTAVLEKEISLLLGGVGTAFYVSIYGIFLSIWWLLFEKLGMTIFEKDIIIIKENTKMFFWNKIDIEEIHFQKSLKNYDTLTSVFSTMDTSKLSKDIDEIINAKIKLFDKMLALEEKAIINANNHLDKREVEQEKFVKSYQKISTDMQILTTNMAQITLSLNSMTTNIQNNEASMNAVSISLNKNVELLNNSLNNISAKNIKIVYDETIKNIENMKMISEVMSSQLNANINHFDENITIKLKNTLEMMDKETSSIVSQIVNLK